MLKFERIYKNWSLLYTFEIYLLIFILTMLTNISDLIKFPITLKFQTIQQGAYK